MAKEPDCGNRAYKQQPGRLKRCSIPIPKQKEEIKLSTYLELKEKAEKLLAEAEIMRQNESRDVIADIRAKMATYGLTVQDLQLPATPNKSHKSNSPIKYRGPNGQTWGGGRGVKPSWIREALDAGKDIDKEFGV